MKFTTILTFVLITYTTLASAQNFRSKNADDAEKLTKEFAKLNKNSPCKDGTNACVENEFAQCVTGKFVTNSCGGGDLKCVVLPLVNSPGTSITCSTEADRKARLDDARKSGAKNPPKQDPKQNPKQNPKQDLKQNPKQDPKQNPNNKQSPKTPKSPNNLAEIRKKNADDAEKLTKDFAKLNKNSPCKDGDQACVENEFAQCVSGKFVTSPCGGNLKCAVLPLVLKSGTSITCTTEADRKARLDQARKNL